jgi:hypothetical protein
MSWRQSWVFPVADSPEISVRVPTGRPPARRRERIGQPRESFRCGRRERRGIGRGCSDFEDWSLEDCGIESESLEVEAAPDEREAAEKSMPRA